MEKLKREYERPVFSFEELMLVERVADVCWGMGHAYLDVDKDGVVSPGDLEIDFGTGCNGNDAAMAINQWFIDHDYPNPNYNANVCNTKEKGLIASQS